MFTVLFKEINAAIRGADAARADLTTNTKV